MCCRQLGKRAAQSLVRDPASAHAGDAIGHLGLITIASGQGQDFSNIAINFLMSCLL